VDQKKILTKAAGATPEVFREIEALVCAKKHSAPVTGLTVDAFHELWAADRERRLELYLDAAGPGHRLAVG